MEINIATYKASEGGLPIPDLKITANLDLPSNITKISLQKLKSMYKTEADKIVTGFFISLPGGLVDAILIELLDKKRSLLTVPFGGKK